MGGLRGAIITQALDAADPVLGFTVGWVNALASRLERLEVICLARGESELGGNVGVEVLPSGRFARYRRVRAVLRRLRRDGALDFVLAHMCPSYAVAATFPTRIAPTFLWYAHSSVTRMLRLADRRCNRLFSCSAASYPLPSRRLVVVGHGIDTAHFTPPAEPRRANTLRLCSVGRLTRSKRIELVVDALARLRARRSATQLSCRIMGPACTAADEAYLVELRRRVEQAGLGDVIRIEGPLTHEAVVGVYRDANAIANMTEHHSLDKATLEAMACGCLVLTTNDAFAPVLGKHAALMVRPGASPDALADALDELGAMSVERRGELGRELRQMVVADHSLERMMDRIVEEIRTAGQRE